MVAFLYSTLLNLAILDLAILVFPFKLNHTCQDWFPHLHKKNFTHSLWPNLKMEAILNSAILNLDTAILHSAILVIFLSDSLNHTCSRFSSHHLTQTNSIWLKLIYCVT